MKKIIYLIAVSLFASCGNSFNSIEKESIEKFQSDILNDGWAQFYSSKEYKNGMSMSPPFIFDKVIVFHLNQNQSNINFNILEKSVFNEEWDGLSLDKDGLKNMIKNNIPIIQVSYHWWDPQSSANSNGWYNYTYFYPEAKIENDKLVLGTGYRTDQMVDCFNYFPYYYEAPSKMLMSSMGAMFLDLKDGNSNKNNTILYNGNIIKVSELFNNSSDAKSEVNSDTIAQGVAATEVSF